MSTHGHMYSRYFKELFIKKLSVISKQSLYFIYYVDSKKKKKVVKLY